MTVLGLRALAGLAILMLVFAALIFGAAGTTAYWQGWIFLAAYLYASLAITLDLMRRDPALLARRMRGGPFAEKQPAQRLIMAITSLGFIALLVVPGLDRRFGWSAMPPFVALGGDGLVLLGFAGIGLVFRVNSFTSATIETAREQRVISAGPYAVVRHPMYASALVMLLGIPIALGSWWGLSAIVAMLPILIWRLIDEERFLAINLPGYADYQRATRYRLVPGVW